MRRAWTSDWFRVHGFAFCLRTNHRESRRSLARLYEEFRVAEASVGAVQAVLESDGGEGFHWKLEDKTGAEAALPGALWGLEAALCEAAIVFQKRLIALHAAAASQDRRTALLVGRSGAGKSTLSLALARRGLSVATDDVTLIEPDTLRLLPIPRCFHLDPDSVALLEADGLRFPGEWKRSRFLVPRDFGGAAPAGRAEVVVFITGPREERPGIAPVSQAEMAARLLSETGQSSAANRETVSALSRLAAGASCYTLAPGPLTETADAVARLIRGG